MADVRYIMEMKSEPVIPTWEVTAEYNTVGTELQWAIINGFSEHGDHVWSSDDKEFVLVKTFTFKEHGEFFRGALTLARLRYVRDFYELLKRYETIKVTIRKNVVKDKR